MESAEIGTGAAAVALPCCQEGRWILLRMVRTMSETLRRLMAELRRWVRYRPERTYMRGR